MKDNNKLSIFLEVLPFIILISFLWFDNMRFSDVDSLKEQVDINRSVLDYAIEELDDLKARIDSDIKQASILSDYSITYANIDAIALTNDIIIEVVPKESKESTKATITLGDKVIPMSRQGSSFKAIIPVPIDLIYSQFVLDFKEGDTIRSEVVAPGNIGFVNYFTRITEVFFSGEISSGVSKKNSYHGELQVHVPKEQGEPLDIKLSAVKNDSEIIFETKSFFYHKGNDYYAATINETFTLNKKDSLYLIAEIKDNLGFTYKVPLLNTAIFGVDSVAGDSISREPEIYDAQGNAIEFKDYK